MERFAEGTLFPWPPLKPYASSYSSDLVCAPPNWRVKLVLCLSQLLLNKNVVSFKAATGWREGLR